MFSDKVSMGNAVFISVFSIVVVFLILLSISYLVDITAKALSMRKQSALPSASVPKGADRTLSVPGTNTSSGIDPLTLAVISAAVDAHEKGRSHEIKSIK